VWKWSIEAGLWNQVTHGRGDVEKYDWFPDRNRLFLEIAPDDENGEGAALAAHSIVYDGNFRPWESVPILEAVRRATPVRKEYRVFDFRTNLERAATSVEIERFLHGAETGQEGSGDKKIAVRGGAINGAKTSPDRKSVAYLYTVRDPTISQFTIQRIFIQRQGSEERIYLQMDSTFIEDFWWSSDSETVYYTEKRGNGHSMRLMAASAESGVSVPVFAAPSSDYFSQFSADAKALALPVCESAIRCLRRLF